MWQKETVSNIYERIRADAESRVTDNVKIPQKSLLGILLIVFAGAVNLLYGFLFWLSKQLFLDTAEDEFVDRQARSYGMSRRAATFAEGEVQFVGVATTPIPEGTKVQNADGVLYSTTVAIILDGGGLGQSPIICDVAGTTGNITDTTMQLETPISGVNTDVNVLVAPNGGEETETTEQLRARVQQRKQNPPASGSVSDYIRWATSIEGVSRAWVLAADEYKGAGTVAVLLSDENLDPVGATIKQNVEDYINEVRPVKAEADILDVTTALISYDIKISPNNGDVQAAIDKQLTDFHLSVAQPGGTILISGIRGAIDDAGVDDYEITEIRVGGVAQPTVGNIVLTAQTVGKYDQSVYSPI